MFCASLFKGVDQTFDSGLNFGVSVVEASRLQNCLNGVLEREILQLKDILVRIGDNNTALPLFDFADGTGLLGASRCNV